jgi:hypothetical protein
MGVVEKETTVPTSNATSMADKIVHLCLSTIGQ